MYLGNVIFLIVFVISITFFTKNLMRIISNIKLGKDINRTNNKKIRFLKMIRIALGQTKMFDRPIAAFFHLIIYVGFIIINIEVIEIIVDGVFGTHRFLSNFVSYSTYNFFISTFEFLAVLVLISCVVFLYRRNIQRIKRFHSSEMTSWPKSDANLILIFEVLLMSAFLVMNAADTLLQSLDSHYHAVGAFTFSSFLVPLLDHLSAEKLIFIERFCWWFHIIGILLFLNYVLISKHLHIFFAFFSAYYSKLSNPSKLSNLSSITSEVKMMLDPNIDPFSNTNNTNTEKFGAQDADDLNWVQILNSYSCTECGRCTSVCPANITGKKLSPRKILMDTRDRITEIGNSISKKKNKDENFLLGGYIQPEEVWACTTCNACGDACPIELDPMSIIIDLRRYLVMEESSAPSELNTMFNNIENNGAPWQYNLNDKMNWINDDK